MHKQHAKGHRHQGSHLKDAPPEKEREEMFEWRKTMRNLATAIDEEMIPAISANVTSTVTIGLCLRRMFDYKARLSPKPLLICSGKIPNHKECPCLTDSMQTALMAR